MADFAVADPEEGLNEQGDPNPITPSGFGENLGASLNTSPSGVFGGLGFLSRALGRESAASGVSPSQLIGPGAGFLPYDLHPPEPSVPVASLQARFPDAKFKEPLPLTVATDLAKSQADAAKQSNLYARYPNGFFANAPLVGAQIVAGLLDPVNDAAFMVPVVGETRYAQWLARAGSRAGLAGRLAVTAGVGGARGAAGAAILAGAEAPLAANEDQPITLGQAGRDILSAGLSGALLHTGLSFHSDVLGNRFIETPEGRSAAASADLHDSAVQTAAAQMASGRPVEVQPVFDAARTRAELLGSTALTPVERDPLTGVRTENAVSRAQGAPGQDELRWAGDARAARAEPGGLAVSDGQIAEARAAVERMRVAGHLTAEDEDMLAQLEQEPQAGGGFRTNPMRIADEHADEVRGLETQAFAAVGERQNVARETLNTENGVQGATSDRTAFERQRPFYSALTRSLENHRQERAPAAQWSAIIDNLPGVKKEEVDWSGVKEWLGAQKGPVTKAALLEHLRANEVQIREVEKGGKRAMSSEDVREWADISPEVWDGMSAQERGELSAEARKESGLDGPPKFSSYTLSGGENYREMLLTLPERAPELPEGYEVKPFQQGFGVFGPDGDEVAWAPTRGGALANAAPSLARKVGVSPTFRSSHFEEPNILAHVRFDDRTGPNGEKILHVAEIQSDWHQQGRRRGYQKEFVPATPDDLTVVKSDFADNVSKWAFINRHTGKEDYGWGKTEEEAKVDALRTINGGLRRAIASNEGGVPNAPFKATWHELAMKRLLRYAAEHGYDKLSWDTGETQAARYDLSKQIDDILYRKEANGDYYVGARKDGKHVLSETMKPEKLADTFGKDVADKIIAGHGDDYEVGGVPGKKLFGIDLKVGGEGMRGFYDKILPNFLNKYAKKWGAKVEDTTVGRGGEHTLEYSGPMATKAQMAQVREAISARASDQRFVSPITGGRLESQINRVSNMSSLRDVEAAMRDGATFPEAMNKAGSSDLAKIFGGEMLDAKTVVDQAAVHSMDITPQMRESVMQGQPLFQRGGESRAASGEKVKLNDDVIATLPTESTAAERPILERVAQIAREIVPRAKVVAARTLEPGETIKAEFGDTNVTGAVYTNGVRRMIAWSLESADAEGTFRHEAVHWLSKEGFFKPEEWSALEGAARDGDWIGKHDIDGRYPGLDQTGKLEEAIADEFGAWRRAPDLVPEALRPIYQKLMELLARVADFVRTTFGANATANDIFSRLTSGEVGARTPAETPRYGSTAFELSPEEQARADMDKAVAARKKLTAYQDLQKRQALIESVRNFHEQTVNRPTLRHPLAGIERRLPLAQSVDALTRGISEAVKGGRESTASEQLARANDFLGGFQAALDKIDGGMSAWRSRALTKEWVRELSELNKPGGRPGVSGSPMALEIARAVKQAQDVARMHLNRSGAWIGDYDGYVSRTAHNAVKIDRAGYAAWKEFTLARLDQDRTFADLDSEADRETGIDRFMHGVWDGLSTGIHLTSQEGVGKASKAGAFSGPGNLGKRLSSERVLHWADADGWREYQEKFGDQVIERGVMNTLHRTATDSALMRRWGSNPQYTFDNLLRSIKEEYRDDHEGVRAFQGSEARLREEFAYLSGAGNMTGQSLAWKIRSSVLAWQDITKLGNVLFAHFSTFATKPFQLMYHGVGPWQAYTSTLRNFVQENTPEARSTLENLRSNATGLTQNILTGYEPIDGVPGRISGLRQKMMRLGGLPWALGLQKSGTEWELANFLGQRVGSEFSALHPATQRALKIYGIDAPEWDALRGAPGHDTDGQGSTYLTPQAAARATDAAIDGLTGGRIAPGTPPADAARIRDETRDRLMMKLAAYYSESADRSTITPGVPERAVFSRIAGRFGGSIIGQYKTWATAAVRQIWGQALYGSSRGEALKAMAGVIAVGTAAGYLRTVVTDLLSGKVPRMFNGDPVNDAEILIGSMVKGSGMGILGDMILGQFEANAGSGKERALKYIAQLAGPLIGDVADLGGVGFDYATAPLQKHPEKAVRSATANALHEVQQHLPLVNLFYVRTIMNWLIWDRLYEMASPGYLKRYQAHVKQMSHGQSYLTLPGGYQPGAPTQYLGHAMAPVAQ